MKAGVRADGRLFLHQPAARRRQRDMDQEFVAELVHGFARRGVMRIERGGEEGAQFAFDAVEQRIVRIMRMAWGEEAVGRVHPRILRALQCTRSVFGRGFVVDQNGQVFP
jgi:hypothetical protein